MRSNEVCLCLFFSSSLGEKNGNSRRERCLKEAGEREEKSDPRLIEKLRRECCENSEGKLVGTGLKNTCVQPEKKHWLSALFLSASTGEGVLHLSR